MKKINFLLVLMALLLSMPTEAKVKPRVIAHRGFWTTQGSAQNSIHSLQAASAAKVYGSEFDVHLTADNVPVVHHDNTIDGIEIQNVPYAQIKDIKLSNGETLPTLDQYLNAALPLKKMKLIFELKPHATPERDREAAAIVVRMVNDKKLAKRTEYIAFSLEAAKELRCLSPKTPVYYLNGELSPSQLKDLGFSGLDYHYNVIQKNPSWVEEAHNLGLKVNVWTVNDAPIITEMIGRGVDFITTNEPVLVEEIIANK